MLQSYITVDPLDVPNLDVSCFSYDNSVTYIKLTWEPVDCAELYWWTISEIDSDITIETFYEASYNMPATNISGSLFAIGGSVHSFFQECLVAFNPNPTTPAGWFCVSDCIYTVLSYTCTCMHKGSFVYTCTSTPPGDDK